MTFQAFQSLKRSDLQQIRVDVLRKPSSTRPTLWSVAEGGKRAVVKDYSANGFFYRNLVGRFLVWRETKAYRRLRSLQGVPALYRVMDGLALVLEEIPGVNVEGLEEQGKLSDEFFSRLRDLVENFHQRGIAHCDLKRAANVLVGHDGLPYVIDWSAAILKQEFRFFPFSRIYRRFLLDDFNAITKLQLRHCPEKVSPQQKQAYERRSKMEQWIRAVRDGAREILKKVA